MKHALNFVHPHRLAAVGVLFEPVVDGRKRAGPVVLGPVELDAARNPRPREAYQRGLNHLVVVHKMAFR
jgi:hypothetical protein